MDEVNLIPITVNPRALHLLRAAHLPPLILTLCDPIRLVYRSHVNPRQDLDREDRTRIVAHQPHPSIRATIFLIWRILVAQLPHPPRPVTVCRSIRRLSNALYARSALHVHTICGPIYEHTLTSDRSFAPSAGKLLPANTTANGTKDCIVVRRGSSAEENSDLEGSGAVAGNLHAPTRWADISDLRREGFASNRFWTRRLPKEREDK